MDFIVSLSYIIAGKALSDYTNSLSDYTNISNLRTNMEKEGSLDFRLRKMDKTSNCLLDEVNHNDLKCEKCKKTWKYLIYVELLPILVSKVSACALISAFASLVCVPVGITSFALEMKVCAFTAEIKKYKSIMKKKRRSMIKSVVIKR